MTIETRYNIGDEVWAIFSGVHMLCKIEDVALLIFHNDEVIAYSVSSINERHFGTRFTSELFPTKEELLKSL